jgi:hypothetical protein
MTQIKSPQTPPQLRRPTGTNLRNRCHLWESAIQIETGDLAIKHDFREIEVSLIHSLMPASKLFVTWAEEN